MPPDQRRPRDRSLAQVPSSDHHIADAIAAAHYTDDQRAPPLFKTEGVPEIPDPFVFGLGWRNMTRHSSPHCITDFYRFLPIFTDFSDFLGRLLEAEGRRKEEEEERRRRKRRKEGGERRSDGP